MFDDTCYFLPCESEEEGVFFTNLLNSEPAQLLIRSLSFPDNKRPINIDILRRIDLKQLAALLGVEEEGRRHFGMDAFVSGRQSLMVFEEQAPYGRDH